MPRTAIDLPDSIVYLSILDENGQVDTKLMPDLSADQVRHLHRIMLLSRRFNQRLLSLQRQERTRVGCHRACRWRCAGGSASEP